VFEHRLAGASNAQPPAEWTYHDSAWDLLGLQGNTA
jgi:hypothetical protein